MGRMEGLCVADCERCPRLVGSRSHIINGIGPDDADLLFLGEAPGAKEDEGDEPFMDHSGSVLDDALHEADLARADARITNCVWCRPPDSRDPTSDKLSNCRGYLVRGLEFVDPELVVTLGKVPSQHLLDRSVAIMNEFGSIIDAQIGDASYRALLSVHPAATLCDRSQHGGLFETIAHAADLSGLTDSADGQASLDDF